MENLTKYEEKEMSDVIISEKGVETPLQKKSVQFLKRKFNNVNNILGDLTQLEVDYIEEIKDLNKKINELTEKHIARKKELRMAIKIITQKRLIKLGERMAYSNQIVELGGKVNRINAQKLLRQIK